MEKQNIYQDISARTGGEIYLGVVGPVRSGKSTFIKRFMELLVLPEIKDENERKRTMDELPQSGTGKMVMTTEPKFIPKEAAELPMEDMKIKIRLIDCVGFMIPGAGGNLENGQERLVKTPWFDYEVPFTRSFYDRDFSDSRWVVWRNSARFLCRSRKENSCRIK